LILSTLTRQSESRHTDSLSDRKCRAEGKELYGDEEKDARLAHAAKWFIIWCHRTVREEIKYFCGNAVSGKFIKAHVPAETVNLMISIPYQRKRLKAWIRTTSPRARLRHEGVSIL
jgi:hypothetical protein